MGKAGRFACIFLPMAMTIAALICLVLVFLGQQNKNDSNLSSIYYLKADTTNFTSDPSILKGVPNVPGTKLDDQLLSAINSAATTSHLENIYTVGIWSYCSGPKPANGASWKPTYCSRRSTSFYFNPIEVWGLNGTNVQNSFPKQLQDGLSVYRKVSRWMVTAHAIAFFVTAAEIVVGIFAIFSRWGSCVTSIVASAGALFTLAAAITATAVYATLAGTFNTVLKPYGIEASIGKRGLTIEWLAVAFSVGASVFWLFSMCCCSGRSNHQEKDYNHTRSQRTGTGLGGLFGSARNRGTTVEKTPYTYEPVGGYQPAGQNVPLMPMEHGHVGGSGYAQRASAYEPYRQS